MGTTCTAVRKQAPSNKTNNGSNMNKNLLGLGLIALLVSGTASAAPLFSDAFNRADNNAVGNGWSETSADGNDVAINSNALRLRDNRTSSATAANPDASASFSVPTLGYENLSLSFRWAPLAASDDGDYLNVGWRIGTSTTWNTLWSTSLGGGEAWSEESVSLGSTATDQQSIEFRFWTDVSSWFWLFDSTENEGARIDWVSLTGTAIEPEPQTPEATAAPVSEPITLALLGLGLSGLILQRKRRSA